ncbi:DUF4190 domain-containing protein [Actinomadura darangshiensis]|uniref:DUF4190 domain-containing protein n=2 Tax=Actinomadura darangshiensis TaxID=705336 RepID=A0A4R5A6J3_9ACTN|nr:DUF4190 domain-containing protein [Actinomadura darangshiensis]
MPSGPDYGSPYDSRNDKTNGLAIAAFITGLLGCFGVLGLILGAISLSQIGRNGGKGRGLAIAGIILSCLWIVVGIGVFALRGSSGSSSDAPKPKASETKEVDAQKMKVGDCINDNSGATTTTSTEAPVEVESVKIVPCTGPHDGEVTAVFKLKGFTLPPESQLQQYASTGCKARTRARINRDPAARGIANSYYYPTDESWRQGDRTVTCVAVAATDGKKLTRPLHR